MSLEENKAIIRSLYKVFNKHNPALLDDIIAPDFVHHAQQIQGLESYKQYETIVYKGFPDLHDTIEDIIAEGDKVWVRVKVTGAHKGELRGLAPTGKKMTWEAVSIWRIAGGKVVELQYATNELNFYKQLGVIEYTEKGGDCGDVLLKRRI